MSHDIYANWATTELARLLKSNPTQCFRNGAPDGEYSIFANRESGRIWPIPDGRLSLDLQSNRFEIAIEFKRTNEGLHGILTAIGQSEAYIHESKGYNASIIVIPELYDTHNSPGRYLSQLINYVNPDLPIGIYTYKNPDTSLASPFNDRLICYRNVGLDIDHSGANTSILRHQRSNTQWAHLREGSSEAHAFYRYLQTAKRLAIENLEEPAVNFPTQLLEAVNRRDQSANPLKYLSNSVGDILHDVAWRNFWFGYVLTSDVIVPWHQENGHFIVNDVPSALIQPDGQTPKKFFSGRANSIKNILVQQLNSGIISQEEAWERFALNVRDRAHSYREDVDSGLQHLGMIESDGKPSDLGYRFVDVCERTRDCFQGTAKLIFGAAILKNGSMDTFLHYFYKLSERRIKDDPLAFTYVTAGDQIEFDSEEYLGWIKNELATNLNVMNTALLRGGVERRPFQGEFAVLRRFGFVSGFRVGLGLEINWPLIQEYLKFEI